MSISKAGKRTEGKRLTSAQRETLRVLNTDEWFEQRECDSVFRVTFPSLIARGLLKKEKDFNGVVHVAITPAGRTALKTGAAE